MNRSTPDNDTSRGIEAAVGFMFSVYLLGKDGTGRLGTLYPLPMALPSEK